MLILYVSGATRCPGLPWTVLAGIGKVESDHGRGGEVSPAGAEGPMQFMPATWAVYGIDGDGDGVADIWDPADAVPSAGHYLCVNGGGSPATLSNAIWNYNHDNGYVRLVLAWAARYGSAASG
jgi:membrane-bound lytic murein transglycosylase B